MVAGGGRTVTSTSFNMASLVTDGSNTAALSFQRTSLFNPNYILSLNVTWPAGGVAAGVTFGYMSAPDNSLGKKHQ